MLSVRNDGADVRTVVKVTAPSPGGGGGSSTPDEVVISPDGRRAIVRASRNVYMITVPPVGGAHNQVWLNCAGVVFEQPVPDEHAVHSLEHGAVWIAYRPDLPQGQVDQLRDLAQSQSCILVSPYPDLEPPIVASAWGKQMTLESADDADLERFVRAYLQGPQTPEPGAACTGGVGEPS